jgi:hypothetical protein
MAMLSFCEIDVSKDRLDVMVLPEQESFAVRTEKSPHWWFSWIISPISYQ